MITSTTMAHRDAAIRRGLSFIYATSRKRSYFFQYGADYLCCFDCIARTSRDFDLRLMARTFGQERARYWRRYCAKLPSRSDVNELVHFIYGCDAADGLGVRDDKFKERLMRHVSRFCVADFLFFDPMTEPPPGDVPEECTCEQVNARGRRTCLSCKSDLAMKSRYWIWFNALTRTYAAHRYGIDIGVSFADVLRWLPSMHPYPTASENENEDDFYWAIYAVTHLVYAFSDYGCYRLSPSWLPNERAFLRTNLKIALDMHDPEAIGEFLDSLESFMGSEADPMRQQAVDYLLATQNEDGSWGECDAADVYERYHPTWTVIDGLREYAWKDERLAWRRVRRFIDASRPQLQRTRLKVTKLSN